MPESATELARAPLTLLLVDEQEASTNKFREELVTLGYNPNVVQIRSRDGMIKWLTSNEICDVVVANHRVADFAAIDVLAVLKELDRNIPVVLLSAPEWDKEKGPLLRAGAIDFILPTEVRRIVPIIENDLRARREIAALKEELERTAEKRQSAATGLEVLRAEAPPPHEPASRKTNSA